MESFTLLNNYKIPSIGFGTWKVADNVDSVSIVRNAIESGYRHIDTASKYRTEEAVGEAVRESGISRKEIFITSKAWFSEMGYDNVRRACENSLKSLKTDYMDLYLIHWTSRDFALDNETWRGMERLYEEGCVRAIGLSNFLIRHMENIFSSCNIAPMVNQLEFHPGYIQWDSVSYAQNKGMVVEAWSPLGRDRLLNHPLILELSEKYGVSHAQLCLKFALQCGIIPLPKSSARERMEQNMQLDFLIEEPDMDRLKNMPEAGFSGEHPDLNPPDAV